MTITHNWHVTSVNKYLDTGGTVYKVLFQITSTDSDNPSYLTITTPGSVILDIETIDPDNFTPFNELTEEQILDWVKERIVKYNIPDTDPVETKYEYEIYHERHLQNLKETITYTPDRPYSDVGYLIHPEPDPVEPDPNEVEIDTAEDMMQVAAEMGIPVPEDWT